MRINYVKMKAPIAQDWDEEVPLSLFFHEMVGYS